MQLSFESLQPGFDRQNVFDSGDAPGKCQNVMFNGIGNVKTDVPVLTAHADFGRARRTGKVDEFHEGLL
jgi:hypothetical protein